MKYLKDTIREKCQPYLTSIIKVRVAKKVCSASGNIAAGTVLGFALGGPVGAGVGATGGALVWMGGEAAGWMLGKKFG